MNAGAGKSSYILSKVPSFLDIFRGSIRVQIKDKILSPGPFYGIRDIKLKKGVNIGILMSLRMKLISDYTVQSVIVELSFT